MLDGLLQKLVPTDALAAGATQVVEAQLVPLFAGVRAFLLARITDTPPATFGDRLRAAGWPLDDGAIAALWRDIVAAIAEEPADA